MGIVGVDHLMQRVGERLCEKARQGRLTIFLESVNQCLLFRAETRQCPAGEFSAQHNP
jgi:hypothetical protein